MSLETADEFIFIENYFGIMKGPQKLYFLAIESKALQWNKYVNMNYDLQFDF